MNDWFEEGTFKEEVFSEKVLSELTPTEITRIKPEKIIGDEKLRKQVEEVIAAQRSKNKTYRIVALVDHETYCKIVRLRRKQVSVSKLIANYLSTLKV